MILNLFYYFVNKDSGGFINMSIRFRPAKDRMVADIIPFYDNECYHVFYLKGYTEESGWARNMTPWGHIRSKDLIEWEELPDAIIPGTQKELDGGACYTGSVIKSNNKTHIFYTGFYPGNPIGRENIMHAMSENGIDFIKNPKNPVLSIIDIPNYGADQDLRDPYVFWNEEDQCFWMVFTSSLKNPINNIKRGVIGLAKSNNLFDWEIEKPIYSPNFYPSLECPDLFKINGWWYLIFSQYGITEYRKSRNVLGPWEAPKFPVFDTGCLFFYAAKTLTDGNRRLLMGFSGDPAGQHDSNFSVWGGYFVTPRELIQKDNGDLELKCPQEFIHTNTQPFNFDKITILSGKWNFNSNNVLSVIDEGFSSFLYDQIITEIDMEFSFEVSNLKGHTGLILRASNNLDSYYAIDFDMGEKSVTVERYKSMDTFYGAYPEGFRILCKKYFEMDDMKIFDVKVMLEKNIIEIFFNGITVTVPVRDIEKGKFGFYTRDVTCVFSDISVIMK